MNAAPTPSPLIDKKFAGDIRCLLAMAVLTALPILAAVFTAGGR